MTATNRQFLVSSKQSGFVLLEALIAILIFSFGILAIMGLQGAAISDVRDAKMRSDAAFLANQIIGYMWADDPANNLANYALNTGGANCAFNGGLAGVGGTQANTNVGNWLNDVSAALPGAANNPPQITVNGGTGVVTVTVCWQVPQGGLHNYTVTAQITGPTS